MEAGRSTAMTVRLPPAPQRSQARANRARILAAAREELARDPEASLEEIARAAGVVRRTVYGHFPNRRALLEALAEEAVQALAAAAEAAFRPADPPTTALARLVVGGWPIGDRYRMLISLGRRDLGERVIHDALDPGRTAAVAIISRGQRDGVFADHLPPEMLNAAIEGLMLALLDPAASSGSPTVEPATAATAVLIAAGVAPDAARSAALAVSADLVG
jgi:AcrR family transcriptional regulator